MALIRCYDCGKEISSLATACPSCGAPPQSTIVPPLPPAQTSRAKRFSLGTIALLTGVVLVLVIRSVTQQPNSPSVVNSPASASNSPVIETAAQSSAPSRVTTETQSGEANTTSSPPAETATHSSPSLAITERQSGTATTTSSPAAETEVQSSPSLTTTETQNGEAITSSSPPAETDVQSSAPSLTTTEARYTSDASTAVSQPPSATYHVIGIPLTDYLNVREGAGADYQVVTKLEPGTGGIVLGTKRIAKGGTTWQEITVQGQTGWVNAAYIGLETQAPTSPTESSTAP